MLGCIRTWGILVCLLSAAAATGCATDSTAKREPGGWRYGVGLTYVNGFRKVVDRFEDNLDAEGKFTESVRGIPVGASVRPYYQFDNGVAVGGELGPAMMILGDADFYDVPISLDCKYFFLPDGAISPYVRGGISYNIAGGDFVNSSDVGFVGGAGIEFFRDQEIGMGIELSFDSSEIEFDRFPRGSESIKPCGVSVSLFAVF